jgi:FtsP/CotA-like multicopper oxidase with cupredoxin domain
MHNMMRIRSMWGALLLGVLGALLLVGSGTALSATLPATTGLPDTPVAGTRTFNLWAKTGTTTLYTGGPTVTFWGYSDSAAGPATLPGPMLIANQGETVVVNLNNTLPQASAILFQGQALAPDTTGAAATTGTKTYAFTAGSPGTFLYEAGLLPNAQHQAAMGMYGALIVRPAAAGQAYGPAATAFTDEALVLVSEIDPALNNSATPTTFDLRNYKPKYFLINGKAYPGTGLIEVTTPVPLSGSKVLLRYVNAGIQHHSMAALGLRQVFVAKGGSLLPTLNHNVAAETLAPGQTGDAIATIATGTANGTKFAVYDGTLMLHNNGSSSAFGGMLTFVNVGVAVAGPDTTGPATSGMALTPNPTNGSVNVALSASVSDVATGGANVTAAEYFIDTSGAPGTGTAMGGTFGSPTAPVNATILAATLTPLASGNHTIYVRGRDLLGNWGALNFATLNLDKSGPTTSGMTLTPNPSNGTVAVALHATGNDTATGGSNITAAEYFIGATGANGTGTAMTVNVAAPVASLDASIPCTVLVPCTGGIVSVHSRDAFGNWGPFVPITLQVVATGPVTSGVSANPNPNNGAKALSVGQPVVRITATMTSVGSNVSGAEAFIDTVGAPGTGILLQPSDGSFNGLSETGFADVPLTTINALPQGNHTISVRGKNATGTWGTIATTILLIDKTAPTFPSISLAPVPAAGVTTSITLTVNGPVADTGGSGVATAEYWIDPAATVPTPGTGTAFTGSTVSIPIGTLTAGNHTVRVRIRDVAGNASLTRSGTVSVLPDAIFSNGFETATTVTSWGWSSDTGNNIALLNATAGSALVGTRGLQAQGNAANYVQFNFGTAGNPASATYDARFYFNPNGNTGTDQNILVARTTGGATVFRVRYRWNSGSPQVQIQVGTGNANTTWTGITNGASNRIEAVWQSGGTLQLFVGGSLVANQSLAAGANSVGQVRLGSVTSGGNATLEYFDAFSSKRTVTPFGP